MPKLGNPLVYDLLDVAQELASGEDGRSVRPAALRRAVSSAYYAVFHALCFVCADALVGWSRTDLLERVYRLLDHGTAKKRLGGREAAALAPAILEIGIRFADLQEARHAADYASPGLAVHPIETLGVIAVAQRTVTLIEDLTRDERLKLAILLIARQRPA